MGKRLIKVKFIKDFEDLNNKGEVILRRKEGEIINVSEENAKKFVELGYVKYLEEEYKEKPLSEFEKNIFFDVNSLTELVEKYKGADVEKEARIQLGRLRKNSFLFEEQDEKYFFIDKIGDSLLFYNKNNANKARIAEQAAKVFEKKQQAKEFGKLLPYFYDKSGLWWLWGAKKYMWEVVDEVDILNMIGENTNEDTISAKNRVEILNALKQEGRKNIPKDIKPTWIQFQDTIVDIKTGEEFEATPEYFVTNPIPHPLHKERLINTPVMDRIFEEWVGKDYVKTLYEIIAYCLIPSYPLNRIFCFLGAGMNGKTKYLELIRRFIGDDNCCATELDTLLTSRFEITRLHKKLICQMGETNFNEMNKTSTLKKLTGGDMIGFEYKNKGLFHETNYAKILIATNNLPTTSDKSIGFYRRWLIIDFPHQFSEKKDILNDIPQEEYEILSVKLLSVLKDLLDKKQFHNEGDIEERIKRYESKSDFLGKFIEENVEEKIGAYITVNDFNKKLISWCKENNHRILSETSVGKSLKKIGFEQQRKRLEWLNDGRGGQARVWLDYAWK